ncbi:hypothetical protein OH690_05180 [Escherichia coli]|nr:hypothetical protein [Escherichia coli]
MIYDYGSLALGGYGLARGGFVGLRAMRTASKLAREEAAAGKFTADLLKVNKADDVVSDAEKLADDVIPEGQDGANIKGETEGTGDPE